MSNVYITEQTSTGFKYSKNETENPSEEPESIVNYFIIGKILEE